MNTDVVDDLWTKVENALPTLVERLENRALVAEDDDLLIAYAIIRPVPDDPIGSLRGAHAGPGGTSEDARSADRAAETSSEEHRP